MTSSILFILNSCIKTNTSIQRIAHSGLTNSSIFNVNQIRFAGHAKWQNIKSTKEANDMAKCKLINRYVMMVKKSIVSQNFQADPKLNGKLADVLAEAQKFNIPKATLERAIVRAQNVTIKSINIDIQGPGGCSVIVRCETDNISFLRRDIRKLLKKHDAAMLGDDSKLVNMFKSQGYIRTEMETKDGRAINRDFAEEAAILANAEEVETESYEDATDEKLSKAWVFSTDADSLNPCKGELEKLGFKILSCDLELVPYRYIDFGTDVLDKTLELQRDLQSMDQVLDVFHNVAGLKS